MKNILRLLLLVITVSCGDHLSVTSATCTALLSAASGAHGSPISYGPSFECGEYLADQSGAWQATVTAALPNLSRINLNVAGLALAQDANSYVTFQVSPLSQSAATLQLPLTTDNGGIGAEMTLSPSTPSDQIPQAIEVTISLTGGR